MVAVLEAVDLSLLSNQIAPSRKSDSVIRTSSFGGVKVLANLRFTRTRRNGP